MVSEKGSTLIEILCVVALVAVLAMAAMTRTQFAGSMELDRSAVQLAADLRWLQQRSINLARGHTNFPNTPKDSVPRMRFTAGMKGGYSISLDTNILKRVQFTSNVQISGNYSAIMFNNDGYANQPVTIFLIQGARSRSVVIDRVGRIRIE